MPQIVATLVLKLIGIRRIEMLLGPIAKYNQWACQHRIESFCIEPRRGIRSCSMERTKGGCIAMSGVLDGHIIALKP